MTARPPQPWSENHAKSFPPPALFPRPGMLHGEKTSFRGHYVIDFLNFTRRLLTPSEPCQILLCKKRSCELAFADPFAMLSRPHVLLSRVLFPLELLSRRFRGGLSHSMQAFAGLSRRDLL